MTAKRITIYCIGVLLMALGFILSAKSDFGISPICSIAYCVSQITGFSFSDMTMVLFAIMFFIALIIRGTRPKWIDFLQLIYCYIFTRCMSAFAAILHNPESLAVRIIFLVLAVLCIGIGATITLNMYIMPNPADYAVKVISEKTKKPLGLIKNFVDIGIVAITCIVALLFGRNILESGVGIGTLVTMICCGRVIALFNHFFLKKMENIYKSSYISIFDKRR